MEEFLRQPLTWNPWLRLASGKMLGERNKVEWGPFVAGPGGSNLDWRTFSDFPFQAQAEATKQLKCGQSMMREAQEMLLLLSDDGCVLAVDGWFGLFALEGNLLAAGHSISEREWPQYKILPNGQFS